MVRYNEESFRDLIPDLQEHIQKHYNEVQQYTDKIELKPNYELYCQLEDLDIVRTFTIRDDERLVGYCVLLLQPHLHHMDDVFAINDFIYIDPEYRGRRGKLLIQFIEGMMKLEGVSVIIHNAKAEHDYGPMLKRLGYSDSERSYSKCLKE